MKEWVIKYWVGELFCLIIAVIITGYKKLSCKVTGRIKEQDEIKLGMQALLRNGIIDSYNSYMEKGYIPIYALENVLAMYEPYHLLGGNGTVTKLVDTLKTLPTEMKGD